MQKMAEKSKARFRDKFGHWKYWKLRFNISDVGKKYFMVFTDFLIVWERWENCYPGWNLSALSVIPTLNDCF